MYMAPEQARREADGVGPHTDVFLLGATLYEVLTGDSPRRGVPANELSFWVRSGRHLGFTDASARGEVPESLQALCSRAMMPDPQDRLPSAAEFVQALQDFLSGEGKRRESTSLYERAQTVLSASGERDYTCLEQVQALLTKSHDLWPDNPALPAAVGTVGARHTRLAIRHGDLRLAEIQLQRVPPSPLRIELATELDKANARSRSRERIRRVALIAAVSLLAAVVLLQYFYSHALDARRAEAERAEGRAVSATRSYETALHRANVRLASEMLATSPQRARNILLDVPPSHRNIEWGLLFNMASPELSRSDPKLGPLWRVDAAPNGDLLIVSTDGGLAILTLAGDLRSIPLPIPARIACFSPDGTRILVVGTDQVPRLITADSAEPITLAGLEKARWFETDWTPDGTHIIAVADGGDVVQVNATSGESRVLHPKVGYHYTRLAVSPATGMIAVCRQDYSVQLLQPDGTPVARCVGHGGGIHSLAFSSTGDKVIAGCSDASIHIWSTEDGKPLHRIRASAETDERGGIAGAQFLPGDDRIGSIGMDGRVMFWGATGSEQRQVIGLGSAIYSLAMQSDLGIMATVGEDGFVYRWALNGESPQRLRGHVARVLVRHASADKPLAGTFGHDNTFRLWDLDLGEEILRLFPPSARYSFCDGRVTPDGRRIVVTTRENVIRVYAAASGRELFSHAVDYDLDDVAISPDGDLVVAGGQFGRVTVVRVSDGRVLPVTNPPPVNVTCIAFSNDGNYFAVGSRENTVRLYDSRTQAQLAILQGNERWPEMVAFSPDSSELAVAGFDSVARIYAVPSGTLLHELRGHTSWVSDLRYTPAGDRLVTASGDGTLRIWDPQEGRELLAIEGDGGPIDTLEIGTSGRLILSFRGKGIEVWDAAIAPTDQDAHAAWQNQRVEKYLEGRGTSRAKMLPRVLHLANSPDVPGPEAIKLLFEDLAIAYPERTLPVPGGDARETLAALAVSLAAEPAVTDASGDDEEQRKRLETIFASVIQPPLRPHLLSKRDETLLRPLRILARTTLPRDDGKQLFISGNRPELGEWKANIVELDLIHEDGETRFWRFDTLSTPMEFKFTWEEHGKPWGESHEWGGTPNRIVDQSSELYEDAAGTLYYLAIFGENPAWR
jgi:WD40 repeat protein